MTIPQGYSADAPAREDVAKWRGAAVLEFGTNWCGICRAAQPLIREGLGEHEALTHVKVEDGKGRPLGRSFRVTQWPTLVFLKDGVEVARVVRPTSATEIEEAAARVR